MKTRALILVIAAALLAGCGSSPISSSRLTWHSCDGRFKCATLLVPVSYSHPQGEAIPLSLIELPASRPHPIADIVLNPGGPGGPGVQFLEQAWGDFPASLRARFTLVSFDPRGVGSSQPLQCLTPAGIEANAALNPAPRTPKQIAAVVSGAKAFVHGCEQNASTAFLSSMSTANNARDMDRLRAALGQKQLTYVGYSYGTYLGTVYAEMFPKHIRAMVFDGAVDTALDAEAAGSQQAAGFETDLHDFFKWCGACLGDVSPAKPYAALFSRFERGHTIPADLRPPLGATTVTYGVALRGVLAALYSKSTWPILREALSSAQGGDGSYLAALAYSLSGLTDNGSFSNIVSAGFATSCLDSPAPRTIHRFERLAAQLSKSAPDFGAAEAWWGLPCLYWPIRSKAHAGAAHAPGAPPILVVGSTGDPATPYAWAQALARQLPRATLLTRTGPGHTAYRSSSCIRRWVDRYLETLKMPSAGTVCPSD